MFLLQAWFEIKWVGHEETSWEPMENLLIAGDAGVAALQEYYDSLLKQHKAQLQLLDDSGVVTAPEGYSGPLPSGVGSSSADASTGDAAQYDADAGGSIGVADHPAGGSASSDTVVCSKFVTGRFSGRTCGVHCAFCACGYPNAPKEILGELLTGHSCQFVCC